MFYTDKHQFTSRVQGSRFNSPKELCQILRRNYKQKLSTAQIKYLWFSFIIYYCPLLLYALIMTGRKLDKKKFFAAAWCIVEKNSVKIFKGYFPLHFFPLLFLYPLRPFTTFTFFLVQSNFWGSLLAEINTKISNIETSMSMLFWVVMPHGRVSSY